MGGDVGREDGELMGEGVGTEDDSQWGEWELQPIGERVGRDTRG